MFKDKKFALFPAYIDKPIVISTLLLVIYGSVMIMSAEMGVAVGDTRNITNTVIKQSIFVIFSLICMVFFSRFRLLNLRLKVIWFGYYVILGLLLSTRIFGSANGAYAWIRFGIFTLQPSEFAKVYAMVLGAKLLGKDRGEKNILFLKRYSVAMIVYVLIILFYNKDLP